MIKKAGIIAMALCLMLIFILILMMAGFGAKTAGSGGPVTSGAVTDMPADSSDNTSVDHKQAQPAGYEEDDDTVGYDICPCVMVKGVVYYDTGYKSTVDGRCGTMDGEITSECAGPEVPTEDNQSNFGKGFGYQYGSEEGTIEVKLDDGNGYVFATEEVKATYKPQ